MERITWAHQTPIYERVARQHAFDPMLQRAGRALGAIIVNRAARTRWAVK